jgi:nitroimidazol reductase NimA-like FMN-containing flavoprotein (pyridoxamine 5'-phosphate oxidase superfamily)
MSYAETSRTKLHRIPARGTYDRTIVHAILDEALVCHLGFVADGVPLVIPTTFVRVDETLFVHGAAASRTLKTLAGGAPVGVTVTLVDGLVLAKTAFHHSMNYRSVVVLGQGRLVEDETEKRHALTKLVEKVSPGRAATVRAPNAKELSATHVIALPLVEVSAKIRTGMPKAEDDPDDALAPVWSGVVPLKLVALPHVPEDASATAYPPSEVPRFFR